MNEGRLGWAAVAAGALLLTVVACSAGVRATSGAPPVVVQAIDQTGRVTEQGTLTVSIEVASSANIKFVFFNFCRLSQSVCYTPVVMSAQGSNWFVGNTSPMSSYRGMTVGVSAGYNITIELNNNVNLTWPVLPNTYPNLTVTESVVPSYYYFEMTVQNPVFGLSGVVQDSATGRALAGASVSLSPGSNSTTTGATGAFAFTGLLNGTYTVSATDPGYRLGSMTVKVSGTEAVADLALTNASAPPPHGGSGTPWWASNAVGGVSLFILVPAIVAVVGLVAYLASRRRTGGPPSEPPAGAAAAPEAPGQ